MRKASVPTEIGWHQTLNALEMMVNKATDDDKSRFSVNDIRRLIVVTQNISEYVPGLADCTKIFTDVFCRTSTNLGLYEVSTLREVGKAFEDGNAMFMGRRIGYLDPK